METLTVEYSAELFADIMECMLDYWQLGETVCGAQDPAVITVSEKLAVFHQELRGYTVVRVKEQYVNSSRSDTFFEFSNREITSTEYQIADEFTGE